MELSDVFIFIETHKPKEVMKFKNEYLKGFESIDTYYECPKYSQTTLFESDSFDEMFEFVLKESGRPYTFYFENNLPEKIKQGIIQVNNNGSICLALSVESENEEYCIEQFKVNYSNYPIFISNNTPLPLSIETLPNL